MSLDEKIGQMVQLEVGMITYRDPRYSAEALSAMSEDELDKTIRQFGLEKQYITADVFLRTDENRANHTKLMNLYWLSNDINAKLPFKVGKAELDTVIGKYKVGSIHCMERRR